MQAIDAYPESVEKAIWPTEEQWHIIQGGKPEIWYRDGGTNLIVFHCYPSTEQTGALVDTPADNPNTISHLDPAMEKLVTLLVSGVEVKVPALMLWEFHGKPCEDASETTGYPRIRPRDFERCRRGLRGRGYSLVRI